MRSSLKTAVMRTVLAALAVLTMAAGCGSNPGTVAYVGDQPITQRQLDEAVAGVGETLEQGQQVSTSAVINVLIHGMLANQIADAKSITVTDAERDKVLKESNLAPLLQVPAAKPVAYDVATQQIVAQKLGAEAYLAEIEKIPVTLNPRFGVLDPVQKTILDGESASLSQPAPAPSP